VYLLNELLNLYFQTLTWEDSVLIPLMELFGDSMHVFNSAHFINLSSHISEVCTRCSFQIQATFFKLWNTFMRDVESQKKLMQFVFSDFDTLTVYLTDTVKLVPKIISD